MEQLPGMMELFSQFLGKQTWFVGEKVKEKKLGVVILSGDRIPCPLIPGLLQITFVDFLAYDILDLHLIFEPKCLDAFPNLKDFVARFEVMS